MKKRILFKVGLDRHTEEQKALYALYFDLYWHGDDVLYRVVSLH